MTQYQFCPYTIKRDNPKPTIVRFRHSRSDIATFLQSTVTDSPGGHAARIQVGAQIISCRSSPLGKFAKVCFALDSEALLLRICFGDATIDPANGNLRDGSLQGVRSDKFVSKIFSANGFVAINKQGKDSLEFCLMGNRTRGSKEENEELVLSSLEKCRKGKMHVTGQFFLSLLLMWLASLIWEIYQGRSDLWTVVVGALFFEGTNRLLSIVISVRPKLLPGLSSSLHALFINTAVSLLHSIFISFAVVIILTNNWYTKGDSYMFTHEQLFSGVWQGAFDLLCFSCGYFAYDQWDMLHNELYNPLAPSLLTHHLVLLICFTSAIYRGVCVNYLILTLVCEMHSIVLHWRRVSRMSGFRNLKSKLITLEWILNWMAFLFTRVLLHMLIFVRLILDSSKFPNKIELSLGLIGTFGLNVLNFILGYDILNAFVKERRKHA